jgi:hypothetical protein
MSFTAQPKPDRGHEDNPSLGSRSQATDFAESVRGDQRKVSSDLKPQYDFIDAAQRKERHETRN